MQAVSARNTAARLICAAIALWFLVPLSASAQTRHAFVVGIDTYDNVPSLAKARNDARAVAEALEEAGFRTDLLLDVAEDELLDALTQFSGQLDRGDEVVFYFAGHGVEIDGRNYLLPGDVPQVVPGQELRMTRSSLPVDDVIDQFNARGVQLSLLILDACRDNPFEQVGTRSLGGTRGLAQEVPPEGTFIMFSAGAGQAALDRLSEGDPDPNSVFTRVLLPRLSEPGLPLRTMVREVRSEVRRLGRTIGHEQFPAVYDQLDGAFTFLEGVPLGQTPGLAPAAEDPCVAARADWAFLGEGSSASVLQAYSRTHAACELMAALASERLEALAPEPEQLALVLQQCESLANTEERQWYELVQSDLPRAIGICREAFDLAGDDNPRERALAATMLGQVLMANEDYEDSIPYHEIGIAAGDGLAINNLGWMFMEGHGVEQDYAMAYGFFEDGAAARNRQSIANLAYMHFNGFHVAQDYGEALRLFQVSAEAGSANAMNFLGSMYSNAQGVEQDRSEAVRWYRAAAEAGSRAGMFNLGYSLSIGRGTEEDPEEAAIWFLAALAVGNEWIFDRLERLREETLRELQRALAAEGYYDGDVDGAPTFTTLGALQAYMAAHWG